MDYLSRSSTSGRISHTGPPLTMRTLLSALIKAYEIQGCFLLRNAFHAHGLDHVILVKLASTAVVSWLLGLTEEQTMAAISHVWMDGHPLRTYRSGTNTIPRKGWAAGDACARAVQLALMVKEGQVGAPGGLTMERWGFRDAVFGGKEFEMPKDFGTWVVENIFFKVMPVEGHGVSAVEAALVQREVMEERGLDVRRDIGRVKIRTNGAANMIINKKGNLSNSADRDHCMQYCVALAMLKGGIPEAQDFQDGSEWAGSAELESLREKIDVYEDEMLTRDYLDLAKKSVASGLTVELVDGDVLQEVLIEYPIGHIKSPQTAARVREKLFRNMDLMFSRAESERIVGAVEDKDMRISDFVDMFVRDNNGEVKL